MLIFKYLVIGFQGPKIWNELKEDKKQARIETQAKQIFKSC